MIGSFENSLRFESSDISVVFRKDIYNEKYLFELGLNNRQVKAVLFVKNRGKITSSDYQEINKTSGRTASRDLEHLVTVSIFKRIGIKKGSYYELEVGG